MATLYVSGWLRQSFGSRPARVAAGNVLETGGGNQAQTDRQFDAQKRGISRESATNSTQWQTPNLPYKQEVAGSSPAPPIASGSAARELDTRFGAAVDSALGRDPN